MGLALYKVGRISLNHLILDYMYSWSDSSFSILFVKFESKETKYLYFFVET